VLKLPVTVLIPVRNEEANLLRCLQSATHFARVVVIDSESTDSTPQIASENGAETVQFKLRAAYPKKRQWALNNLKITTPWVLMLDADEVVPDALLTEIQKVTNDPKSCDGYLIKKGFHFLGRRLRFGGFSHAAVLLFRTGKAKFEHLLDDNPGGMDMEVHERLIVDGTVGALRTPLIHEDFKGLEAYIARHNQYSTWEAAVRYRFLTTGQWGNESIVARLWGNTQERRRFLKQFICRIPCEHWLWFFNHYLLRLGFLEGRAGLIACQLRAQYILCVRAKLVEKQAAAKSCEGSKRTQEPLAK
jgi:glycosyltransferase involved in cell wall biosynthesis